MQVLVKKVNDFIRVAGGRISDHGVLFDRTPAKAETFFIL